MSSLSRFHARAHLVSMLMSEDIRSHVKKHGWDDEVADSLSVSYKDGKFVARVPDEYGERAWIHEYGSPTSPPTAALRNYGKSLWGGSR